MGAAAAAASYEVLVARRIAKELDEGLGEFDWALSRWKVCGSMEIVLGRCTSSVISSNAFQDAAVTSIERLDTVLIEHPSRGGRYLFIFPRSLSCC